MNKNMSISWQITENGFTIHYILLEIVFFSMAIDSQVSEFNIPIKAKIPPTTAQS